MYMYMCWTVRGSNPGGGEIFCTLQTDCWVPQPILYNGCWIFSAGKAPGVWRWPPTQSSAEVKERVSYTSTPSGSSWPVIGRNLPLPLQFKKYIYLYMVRFMRFIMQTSHIVHKKKSCRIGYVCTSEQNKPRIFGSIS